MAFGMGNDNVDRQVASTVERWHRYLDQYQPRLAPLLPTLPFPVVRDMGERLIRRNYLLPAALDDDAHGLVLMGMAARLVHAKRGAQDLPADEFAQHLMIRFQERFGPQAKPQLRSTLYQYVQRLGGQDPVAAHARVIEALAAFSDKDLSQEIADTITPDPNPDGSPRRGVLADMSDKLGITSERGRPFRVVVLKIDSGIDISTVGDLADAIDKLARDETARLGPSRWPGLIGQHRINRQILEQELRARLPEAIAWTEHVDDQSLVMLPWDVAKVHGTDAGQKVIQHEYFHVEEVANLRSLGKRSRWVSERWAEWASGDSQSGFDPLRAESARLERAAGFSFEELFAAHPPGGPHGNTASVFYDLATRVGFANAFDLMTSDSVPGAVAPDKFALRAETLVRQVSAGWAPLPAAAAAATAATPRYDALGDARAAGALVHAGSSASAKTATRAGGWYGG